MRTPGESGILNLQLEVGSFRLTNSKKRVTFILLSVEAKPSTIFGEEERCDTEPFCETDDHPVPE